MTSGRRFTLAYVTTCVLVGAVVAVLCIVVGLEVFGRREEQSLVGGGSLLLAVTIGPVIGGFLGLVFAGLRRR